MRYVIGIDLGGTAVNYTVVDEKQNILVKGLCEHPARAVAVSYTHLDVYKRQAFICGLYSA